MIAIKKIVGCIYDEKKKLTQIIHWDEETRRPVLYSVEALGLDDAVDLFNSESNENTCGITTGKTCRVEGEERNAVDGSSAGISVRDKQGTVGDKVQTVIVPSGKEKAGAHSKHK